jgi:hypothetical protein
MLYVQNQVVNKIAQRFFRSVGSSSNPDGPPAIGPCCATRAAKMSKPVLKVVAIFVGLILSAYMGSYLWLSTHGKFVPAAYGTNGVKHYAWAPDGFADGVLRPDPEKDECAEPTEVSDADAC